MLSNMSWTIVSVVFTFQHDVLLSVNIAIFGDWHFLETKFMTVSSAARTEAFGLIFLLWVPLEFRSRVAEVVLWEDFDEFVKRLHNLMKEGFRGGIWGPLSVPIVVGLGLCLDVQRGCLVSLTDRITVFVLWGYIQVGFCRVGKLVVVQEIYFGNDRGRCLLRSSGIVCRYSIGSSLAKTYTTWFGVELERPKKRFIWILCCDSTLDSV